MTRWHSPTQSRQIQSWNRVPVYFVLMKEEAWRLEGERIARALTRHQAQRAALLQRMRPACWGKESTQTRANDVPTPSDAFFCYAAHADASVAGRCIFCSKELPVPR